MATAIEIARKQQMFTQRMREIQKLREEDIIDSGQYSHMVDALRYAMEAEMQKSVPPPPVTPLGNIPQGNAAQGKQRTDWWRKLCARMDWELTGAATRHADMAIVAQGDNVYLFTVHGGDPVVLKDEKGLFPSDETITKLRMLGYGPED